MTKLKLTKSSKTLWRHAISDLAGLGPLFPKAAIPTIYTRASPNPNDINPNVPEVTV